MLSVRKYICSGWRPDHVGVEGRERMDVLCDGEARVIASVFHWTKDSEELRAERAAVAEKIADTLNRTWTVVQ